MQPIDRRQFLLRSGAASATLAAGACRGGSTRRGRAAADRPNVVLIMADDLGFECLGCYGGTSYKTPRLDELAGGGLRFDHAYSQPLCTPTRLQLMTGQYNFRNWRAFGVLPPDEITFGHMMRAAGYKTCIAGKWQLYSYNPPDFEPEWRGKGMRAEDAGFDEYFLWHAEHTEDKGSRYADPVILDNGKYLQDAEGKYGPDLYAERINDFMGRHRDEPFFVYYPMALTHGPFNPTPGSEAWRRGDRFESNAQKYFGGMVEYMDEIVGRIVDRLEELRLRENTLVLFFSDNGTPRGVRSAMGERIVEGGKGLPTDAGTHVPLIANQPGAAAPGVSDDLVDSTDFIPTLAELCAMTPPGDRVMDGVSFAPRLRGERGNPREWVLAHHDPRPGWGKEAYTKLDRWARGKRYKLYQEGELFDVADDVLEQRPIPPGSGNAQAEAAREKLRRVLERMA